MNDGNSSQNRCSRRRTIRRGIGYVLAFAFLPLVVAGWSFSTVNAVPGLSGPLDGPLPTPPVHDPAKLTAVVVAGNTGAESIDVLAPYEVLAASGRFNVYTVAPERRPLPLFPGSPQLQGLDFVPHFSLTEFDQQVTTEPDVVVVPYVPSAGTPDNAPLLAWLRDRVRHDTTLLTICGGSWVAADAGLLDGREATTHQNVLPRVRREHPAVSWVDGERWVQDGNVISSAGITAAVDATLRVLDQLAGRAAAAETSQTLGYPHIRFLDDPTYHVPAASTTVRAVNLAYRWEQTDLAVVLYDGVGEIEVASIVDLYPRTFTNIITPVAVEPGVVATRHGLHLVARRGLGDGPAPGRVIVPGVPTASVSSDLAARAASGQTLLEHLHRDAAGQFAIDAALHDLALRDTRAAAALVARGIEYPVQSAELAGQTWPYDLLLRPIVLGLLGLAAAAGLARGARRRQS